MATKHTFLGKNGLETKTLSPSKAIRQKCLECSAWSVVEVSKCPARDCALFPFRFGKDPGRKSNMSDEQRKKLSDRMKELHVKSK